MPAKLIWQKMIEAARASIAKTVGWNPDIDPIRQLAMEIVANGHGEAFLNAARRGRPGRDKTLRLQTVYHVEAVLQVKRRKPRIRPRALEADDLFAGVASAGSDTPPGR